MEAIFSEIEISDYSSLRVLWIDQQNNFVAIGTVAYNAGIMISSVTIVSAFMFSNPLITAIYGSRAFGEKLRKIQWLGIIVLIVAWISLLL